MIKNILVPTDGSEYGSCALEYAIYLAEKTGAGLHGLHVVDISLLHPPVISDIFGTMGLPLYQEFSDSIENDLEEKAEALIRAFRARCQAAGLHPRVTKIIGIIEERIFEEAKKVDWIIMAQRGEHFLRGMTRLGSITELVVNSSDKPVMVTPAAFQPIQNIALAYDGSPSAEKALKLAAELAQDLDGSLRTLIFANDEQEAIDLSKMASTSLSRSGVESEIAILRDQENKQLINFIRDEPVQLLVMGAYGQNKLRRLIMGSTTSYVIRNSVIPVLLTR